MHTWATFQFPEGCGAAAAAISSNLPPSLILRGPSLPVTAYIFQLQPGGPNTHTHMHTQVLAYTLEYQNLFNDDDKHSQL